MNRTSSFSFRNGKVAQNRVVVPPMASSTADAAGFVTDATLEHYGRLAQAGAGIVFVEYSFIHASGRGEENQLAVDKDENVAGLMKVANRIHASGALAGVQIVHVGGKTTDKLAGGVPLSPSGIKVPVVGWEPSESRAMVAAEVATLKRWYVEAAARVVRAGFDIVELHAAHGYGLNQWLSPITNHREDNWGGSLANRARLLFEVAGQIKERFPKLLLATRIPGQDNYPGGLDINEMCWVAAELERCGLDLIDVSSGIGGWRRLGQDKNEGYLVNDARRLRSHLQRTPVIGVGGIESSVYIDQVVAAGTIDFAAVGRAILRDPVAWKSEQMDQNA